jgi:hypothetical protein
MKQILFLALLIHHTDKIYGKIIPQTFREKCRAASEIYTGRVIKTKVIKVNKTFFASFETYEVTIVTDKIWKGFVKDTMICLATESICSPNVFHPENNYLVYSKNNQITGTNGGGFNLRISYFRKEIFKLNIR